MESTQTYVVEAIERVARLYSHIESSLVRSGHESWHVAQHHSQLLEEYQSSLVDIFSVLMGYLKDLCSHEKSEEYVFENVAEIYHALAKFHYDYLRLVPRGQEPVELKRFTRIIDNRLLTKAKDILIIPNEEIGESTFNQSVLKRFRETEISSIINKYRSCTSNKWGISIRNPSYDDSDARRSARITIPRVDAANPCRWPTIMHEIGHHLIPPDIEERFDDFTKPLASRKLDEVFGDDNEKRRGWLTEIWCDLFAAVAMGPSVWFSQWNAFLFADARYRIHELSHKDDFPPAPFRLQLIYSLLRHHYQDEIEGTGVEDLIEEYSVIVDDLVESRTGNEEYYKARRSIDVVQLIFKDFFLNTFFMDAADGGEPDTELRDSIAGLVKEVRVIDKTRLDKMTKRLAEGLPIPSVVTHGDGEDYLEQVAELQEILLAGWIYRRKLLGDVVCNKLKSDLQDISGDLEYSVAKNILEKHVVEPIKKFDKCVLRSIQVSEWFDLLTEEKGQGVSMNYGECRSSSHHDASVDLPRLLVDKEIIETLQNEDLKIIPIIDMATQLGTSSVDIRLGTSFEIFHPGKRGVIDFTESTEEGYKQRESTILDLDFLEEITVAPKQFVLAHTMEYIQLPSWLASELDGRSSFARLGLQVHMTAGFVDPGFEGVITLEIFNAGSIPIRLYPGVRIGQLRFMKVSLPNKSYSERKQSKYRGHLAHNTSLQMRDSEIYKIADAKKKQFGETH